MIFIIQLTTLHNQQQMNIIKRDTAIILVQESSTGTVMLCKDSDSRLFFSDEACFLFFRAKELHCNTYLV